MIKNMDQNLYLITPFFNFFKNKHRFFNLKTFLTSKYNIRNLKIILVEGFCDGYSNLLPSYFKDLVYKHVIYNIPQPIFIKENLINLVVQNHLPKNYEYFCWVDNDIIYENNEWVDETIDKLKSNDLVQMFSTVSDQYYNYGAEFKQKYGSIFFKNIPNKNPVFKLLINEKLIHPGFAWATNKKFYTRIKKLWDLNIIGGADSIMSASSFKTTSEFNKLNYYFYSESFKQDLEKYIINFKECNYNYISRNIIHLFHGDLTNRAYIKRHNILNKYNFNKSFLNYTSDGIIYLNNNDLLNEIIEYMKVKEST